ASRYLHLPPQSKRTLGLRLGVRKSIPISRCRSNFGLMALITEKSHVRVSGRYTSRRGAVVTIRTYVTRSFASADARVLKSTVDLSNPRKFIHTPALGAWTDSR